MSAADSAREGTDGMLGQAAREVLARLIEADADEPDTYFVIVYMNGQDPIVKHGKRFREQMSGFGLRELEQDGILLENSRENGRGRLASFYLESSAEQQLEEANAEAGRPTALQAANAKIEALEQRLDAAARARKELASRVGRLAQVGTGLGVVVVYALLVIAAQQQSLGTLALGAALAIGIVFDLSGSSGRSITRAVRDGAERAVLRWLDRKLDPEGERPPSPPV